jgi:hypothetical protein
MDLVIARYNEEVDWINQLNFDKIFIYNKGNSLTTDLKKPIIFQQLKNWGRESDTYLHHIINNYYDLSDITIFVQGHPFDHCPEIMHFLSLESMSKIIDYLISIYESVDSYFDENIVGLGHCWEFNILDDWDKYLWLSSILQVMEITNGKRFIPLGHKALWGAQFAVSKKAIQKYSYNQYKQIKAISDENYYLPWGMEKYWLYLLGNTKSTFEVKYFF